LSGLKDTLSGLLANFDKGQLVGIDIGLSSVKMAMMSKYKKTYKLESYAAVDLSEAAIIEDEIQKPDEIIDAISRAFTQIKSKQRICCIGVDGPNTMTKRMQVSDGTAEEVEDNVLWESEQYIPFGVEDSEIDYFVIRDIKDQDVKDVLVVAARNDISEKLISYTKEAGLIPKVVDLKSIAISNVFEQAYPDRLDELSENGTIIVDFGAQTTTVIVYKNNGPVLTREIPYGGVLITEEIQRQMGLSYEEAEDLKKSGDENGNLPEEIMGIIDDKVVSLMEELRKILNFYIAAGSSEQARFCFATGGGALLPGIVETLSELVGVEVEYLNPFETIEFNQKNFSEDEISYIASSGVVAMGLGLRKV
jgi:type IV pilus assembly protein PilM